MTVARRTVTKYRQIMGIPSRVSAGTGPGPLNEQGEGDRFRPPCSVDLGRRVRDVTDAVRHPLGNGRITGNDVERSRAGTVDGSPHPPDSV